MRPGRGAERLPIRRRPHGLTASPPSIAFAAGNRRSPRAPGRQGPNRRRPAGPIQQSPVVVHLSAAPDASRGRRSWGNGAGFRSGGPSCHSLPGLPAAASRDAKMGRLGAMRDAGDPPPGPAETPSGGCGRDGLLRLLNYGSGFSPLNLSSRLFPPS